MILLVQFMGALYGMLAVLFGAFGAHTLKKTLSEDQLKSFETGVKYQMYHAILLVIIGYNFNFITSLETNIAYCFIIGTFLFSFSIYDLSISASKNKKLSILGPITPIGGLFLVAGWGLLLYFYIKDIF
tara:strand:- start:187201 stop:187587 length:387 start_codon:yes stop_codon:yes gene_type:complete